MRQPEGFKFGSGRRREWSDIVCFCSSILNAASSEYTGKGVWADASGADARKDASRWGWWPAEGRLGRDNDDNTTLFRSSKETFILALWPITLAWSLPCSRLRLVSWLCCMWLDDKLSSESSDPALHPNHYMGPGFPTGLLGTGRLLYKSIGLFEIIIRRKLDLDL